MAIAFGFVRLCDFVIKHRDAARTRAFREAQVLESARAQVRRG